MLSRFLRHTIKQQCGDYLEAGFSLKALTVPKSSHRLQPVVSLTFPVGLTRTLKPGVFGSATSNLSGCGLICFKNESVKPVFGGMIFLAILILLYQTG